MHRAHLSGIAALAGLLLLGGCVADYKRFSEERFSAAPNLSEPCRYQWVAEKAWFRTVDHNGFGWTDAVNYGFPALQRNLKVVAANCPANDRAGAAQARVSAHYLEYANQGNRKAMMLPVVYVQILTFGYMPLEMTNYYAACVEATTPEGPRRAAIAQGKLDAVTNVWGASDSLLHPGYAIRRQNKEQLLHDLTQQAWHKLWTPGQDLAGAGCRDTLNALVK